MATNLYSPVDFPGCDNKVPCDPMPVCPVCGGLQALCRPRFYAGQLLTEEDLNRLDRYMTDKNRLHNRYLHGWGVVCGLEVVCALCNQDGDRGKVVVKPGYALSPCGNDIVVPKAVTVDVCEIINRCRQQQDPCLSPGTDNGCQDAQENWVLAVCYQEQTARDVAALRASSCTEGKQAAGQCGCNGQNPGCTCNQPVANGVNVSRAPQCEPSVVCESYCFRAYKVPPSTNQQQPEMGPLVKRFVCCLAPFMEALGGLPTINSTSTQLQQWLLNLKETLRQFLRREGLYDCEVAQEIAGVDIPPVSNQEAYVTAFTRSAVDILSIALLVVQKCLCSSLLPPCPDPALDDCVPIATVTVARNPCRVIKICNFSSRRFLLTWPNINYWLSWTPIFGPATGSTPPRTLRDLFVRICCATLGERFKVRAAGSINTYFQPEQPVAATRTGKPGTAAQSADGQTVFASLLASALTQHPAGADLGTLLLASIGAPDENGNPLASELELRNPTEFEMLNELLVPLLQMTLPASTRGAVTQADNASELQAMRAELAAMNRQLKDHEETITQLKTRNK